jgi:hypothetical protein
MGCPAPCACLSPLTERGQSTLGTVTPPPLSHPRVLTLRQNPIPTTPFRHPSQPVAPPLIVLLDKQIVLTTTVLINPLLFTLPPPIIPHRIFSFESHFSHFFTLCFSSPSLTVLTPTTLLLLFLIPLSHPSPSSTSPTSPAPRYLIFSFVSHE